MVFLLLLAGWATAELRFIPCTETVVAMSGETDWVSDGQVVFSISNGHRYQGDITGSGCMLSAAIACFLSVSGRDRALEATVAA